MKSIKETERLEAMTAYERAYYDRGFALIAGVDEVGRGPLAGPVLACALILPKNCLIEGVNDSKKLSAKKREALALTIKEQAVDIGIGIVSPSDIDSMNILKATHLAMKKAVENLKIKPDCVLIDGNDVPNMCFTQQSIIKGDSVSLTIAAASIVAKVQRDAMMQDYHEIFPQYGFDKNKGYGTKVHIDAIKSFGLCDIHRRSFVKNFV